MTKPVPFNGISRRALLGATVTLPLTTKAYPAAPKLELAGIEALAFDTQGTLLNYYGPMTALGNKMSQAKGVEINWQQFIIDWNGRISSGVKQVISGGPWVTITDIQRIALDDLLTAHQLADKFNDDNRSALVNGWALMQPWPDCIKGMTSLKNRYAVTALTNMSMPLALKVVRNCRIPFDTIITSDMIKSYKPSQGVYEFAVGELSLAPNQILMVAAHKWDLKAAKQVGLKTAFIPRPVENGPGQNIDVSPEPFIDITATDLTDLADKLGTN